MKFYSQWLALLRSHKLVKPRSTMLRSSFLLVFLVSAATFDVAGFASSAEADSGFWSGESDGFKVTWTRDNLVASKGSSVVFSAQQFAKQGLAHFVAVGRDPETGKMQSCSYERHFQLLAVVGSLLSFSDRYDASCAKEAHPGGETRLTTIDLASTRPLAYSGADAFGQIDAQHPGKAVRLTDLFSDRVIFAGLLADPKLARLFAQDGGGQPAPKSLAELLKGYAGKIAETPDCFSVPDDLLTRFALGHVGAQDTTVELGLPGAGPCRDHLTRIELRLPMSSSLKAKVGDAGSGKARFAGTFEDQSGKKETVIHLHTVQSKR